MIACYFVHRTTPAAAAFTRLLGPLCDPRLHAVPLSYPLVDPFCLLQPKSSSATTPHLPKSKRTCLMLATALSQHLPTPCHTGMNTFVFPPLLWTTYLYAHLLLIAPDDPILPISHLSLYLLTYAFLTRTYAMRSYPPVARAPKGDLA